MATAGAPDPTKASTCCRTTRRLSEPHSSKTAQNMGKTPRGLVSSPSLKPPPPCQPMRRSAGLTQDRRAARCCVGRNSCFCQRRSSAPMRSPNGSSTAPSSPGASRRGAGEGALAHPRAVSRRGAGRRDGPRHQGAGGGGARHHHRRRNPPRELFEPLRHRARRDRYRQSRHRARPLGPSQSGAPDRRQDPPQACGRGRGPQFPAPPHGSQGQDDRAGPVHHEPAGAERLLSLRRRSGDGLCGGGQRRDQGPVRSRRRRRPDRRALHAGPARSGRRIWPCGAEPRARRRQRRDRGAYLLRLRGDHPSAPERLFVPARSSRAAAAARSRSRPPSRTSTARC